MRKILSALSAAVLFLMLFSVGAFAYDTVVDDAAGLFSADEIYSIEQAAEDFALNTDYSLAVVTTDDAQGKSAMEYADSYYDSLIFDGGWSENGMLFLIDMDNREIYISTAGECISAYEYAIDSIIDSGYDELVSGYYADCILLMIDEAKSYQNDESYYYDEEYSYDYGDNYYYDYDYGYDSDYDYIPSYSSGNSFEITHILFYIVIALVIAAVAVFAVKSRYKNMGKGDEFDADDVLLNLTGSTDNIVSRNVVTTRIPRNNNHHRPGGGMGGGMSHRSGGGIRHGGGGRKF